MESDERLQMSQQNEDMRMADKVDETWALRLRYTDDGHTYEVEVVGPNKQQVRDMAREELSGLVTGHRNSVL